MKQFYSQILLGLKKKHRCCTFSLLLFIEALIFCCLNTPAKYIPAPFSIYSSRLALILTENMKAAALLLALGLIPMWCGILFGTYVTINNMVATAKWFIPSTGIRNFLFTLLPHGIIEVGAMIMCIVTSTILSGTITAFIYSSLRGSARVADVKTSIFLTGKIIVGIIIPMIVSAALIESFITGLLSA